MQRGLDLGSAPDPSSRLQRGPFEGNGVNIHLTGSPMAYRLVLAGASTALSSSSLTFLPPVLPPFYSVVFSSSSGRVFAELGCTEAWELGEEGGSPLEPHIEEPR